jgi:hypothetical protein
LLAEQAGDVPRRSAGLHPGKSAILVRALCGGAGQWAGELTAAVLEHRAGGFVYIPAGDGPADVALGGWAHEVVPAVRAAVAAHRS